MTTFKQSAFVRVEDLEQRKKLIFANWVNKKEVFKSCEFKDFEPRQGFKCAEYY